MDRMTRLLTLGFLVALASCGPEPTKAPVPKADPVPVPTEKKLFPSPFFPTHDLQIEGRPVAELATDWASACVYAETRLDEKQRAYVAQLLPAGGEGQVGIGFTEDFDGDGKKETVSYGAYAKSDGEEGNFVLVTREGPAKPEVLLLKELPGPPQFTVFTLKPDHSLWFGGGIDAGEVTMKIDWDTKVPVFRLLTEE